MSLLARIASAFGQLRAAPVAVEAKATGARRLSAGRVVPTLSLWHQLQRIGGSLTPAQVSSIIREADLGDMRRLMDLANEARQKDCHLQSVLQTSEESVAGLDWELELPEKATKKERKAADTVDEWLRAHGGIGRLVAHQAGARYYGYAVSEILWAKRDGYLVPSSYEHLAPRRFAFDQATGAFIWRDELMPQSGVNFRKEYPDKFVVSQPRVTGDVPCREGLVRVLMWAALFRNWSIADWLRLGEIAWKPWRLGQYAKGASNEDIDNLEAILESMTASGTATFPDTTNVKIEWPGNSGGSGSKSSHEALCDKMASEMSKAVLGQTLTTEQGRVGSQALGKVQNEVRKDLREANARSVAADLTRDLVEPCTRLNWGPRVRHARLRFVTEETADLVALATGVGKLVDAGVRIPEVWVQDQAGIPEPKDGERVLGAEDDGADDEGETDEESPPSGTQPAGDDAEEPPEPVDE